jgi:hypothetical protein
MRSVVVLVSVAVACALPGVASAQVFTFVSRTGSPRETERSTTAVPLLATQPIGIRDCQGETWRFRVNFRLSGTSTPTGLEYWIGAEMATCGMSTNRTGTTQRCWRIEGGSPRQNITPTIPTFSDMIDIPAARIIDPVNGNCTASPTGSTTGSVYLSLLTVPLNDTSLQTPAYAISYDLQAPDAPTNPTATGGESEATVEWSYQGSSTSTSEAGATTTSRDLYGFWILCDPSPNVTTDGGTSADAGDAGLDASDTGSNEHTFGDDAAVGGSCGTGAFPINEQNFTDEALFRRYQCGFVSAGANQTTVTGLTNGQPYRFVVVAQDLAGNRTLSTVSSCVVPGPVTDFWESYRGAGGGAKTLACAAGPARGGHVFPAAWIAVFLAGAGVRLRRRRVR